MEGCRLLLPPLVCLLVVDGDVLVCQGGGVAVLVFNLADVAKALV
jgi:hypothetical protein